MFCKSFCFHTWSKWRVVGEGVRKSKGPLLAQSDDWYITGRYMIQRRECAVCGLTQERINKS